MNDRLIKLLLLLVGSGKRRRGYGFCLKMVNKANPNGACVLWKG